MALLTVMDTGKLKIFQLNVFTATLSIKAIALPLSKYLNLKNELTVFFK